MSVEKHSEIKEKGGIYFFTTRVLGGNNIFIKKRYIDIIKNAYDFAEKKRNIKNLIWTIMPNHLHWIFKLDESNDDPIPIYQYFKRHTARETLQLLMHESQMKPFEIVRFFRKCRYYTAEELLRSFKIRNNYQLWERKPDLKLLYSSEFIRIKVNYIYENPFREPWTLVQDPQDYPFTYINWDLINEFLE